MPDNTEIQDDALDSATEQPKRAEPARRTIKVNKSCTCA
jgi:hypothetical protein